MGNHRASCRSPKISTGIPGLGTVAICKVELLSVSFLDPRSFIILLSQLNAIIPSGSGDSVRTASPILSNHTLGQRRERENSRVVGLLCCERRKIPMQLGCGLVTRLRVQLARFEDNLVQF